MERMEDKEVIAIQYRKISELEKENKNLNEERDNCLKEVKLCYNDIHSLEGQISDLEKENKNLKEENNRLKNNAMEDMRVQTKSEEENKKLREFKEKREESMFYFKAQMERAKPKTASEAEDLQKAKELFERLYREELSCLEEENKKLNIKVASLEGEIKGLNSVIDKLHKEIEEQDAEGHGLFDEIDYRKRECKNLEKKTKLFEGEYKHIPKKL